MGHIRYELDAGTDAVSLAYITLSSYDRQWRSIPHTHDNTEIFCCLSGEGRFRVADADLAVSADDVVIVNPQTPHTEYSPGDAQLEYAVLGVRGAVFTDDEGKPAAYRTVTHDVARQEIRPLIDALLAEVSRQCEGYRQACADLMDVTLIRLQRQASFTLQTVEPESYAGSECLAIKRYIDDHCGEPLSLDTLAERTHLSRYYLAHVFQQTFGIPPMQYVTKRRVQEAQSLLLHTDHRMVDISRLLGFSSQSYFSQCFQREVGMTPKAYRQRGNREK